MSQDGEVSGGHWEAQKMQETKVLSCISAEGGEAPGTVLSRGRSLSLVACRGLLLLLAPAGLGPEDSGVLSACCRVPSSFPPHPEQAFCASKDPIWPTCAQAGGRCCNEFASSPSEHRRGPGGDPGPSPSPVFTLLCQAAAQLLHGHAQ